MIKNIQYPVNQYYIDTKKNHNIKNNITSYKFIDYIQDAIKKINIEQNNTINNNHNVKLETSESDINKKNIALKQSILTIKFANEMRKRIMTSYQEIMNMQI